MPSYGGSNGPDGSRKTGDQGQGTRDRDGGNTGGGKSVGSDKPRDKTRAFGKPSKPAATVPNFPNADALYGPINGLVAALPGGTAVTLASKILAGSISATPADVLGLSPGQQQGTVGVGHDFSMDHEKPFGTGNPTKTKKKPTATATATAAAPAWTNGRNPSATALLADQILSQSLNPLASQILLGA